MLEQAHRDLLLDVARASIRARIGGADAGDSPLAALPPRLEEPGASFVTLNVARELRGCIGSIIATRPLAEDVSHNARAAAFADPRFAPLTQPDMPRADLEVSVLGPLEVLAVASEAELLAALRPGVDGLLLRFGTERATFLPKVWNTLGEPAGFLRQLKRKMGRADDFWDAALIAERYRTEEFSGPLVP